jgi:hypothetical protein
LSIVKDLSANDKSSIVKLASKYPPATRALLGALLEEIGEKQLINPLQKSLNLITVYKLPGVNKIIATAQKWNII